MSELLNKVNEFLYEFGSLSEQDFDTLLAYSEYVSEFVELSKHDTPFERSKKEIILDYLGIDFSDIKRLLGKAEFTVKGLPPPAPPKEPVHTKTSAPEAKSDRSGRIRLNLHDEYSAVKAAGACKGLDPDFFFPEDGAGAENSRGLCRGCRVQALCGEIAVLSDEKYGIWGGLTEDIRRGVRRKLSLGRRAEQITEMPVDHPVRVSLREYVEIASLLGGSNGPGRPSEQSKTQSALSDSRVRERLSPIYLEFNELALEAKVY